MRRGVGVAACRTSRSWNEEDCEVVELDTLVRIGRGSGLADWRTADQDTRWTGGMGLQMAPEDV